MSALLALTLALAPSAPAPLPRPAPRPPAAREAAGRYDGVYWGTPFEFVLHPDGYYTSSWGGCPSVGRWRLDGWTLRVEEWLLPHGTPPPPPGAAAGIRWRVRLARDRRGRVVRRGLVVEGGGP